MAVIIRVGYETRRLGTIEATPAGVVVRAATPEDEADLRGIVRELRGPGQSDEAALRDIPRQLNNGYYWARDVADEPLMWPDGELNADKARWLEAEYPAGGTPTVTESGADA